MILMHLIVGALVSTASALPWNGPQQTGVATSTPNWSPAPTKIANNEAALELRSSYPVSVCGWIGGNVQMPAYCSTQSSCVWNSDNRIVGCCATTESNKCKFYSSCVDINSPKQTEDRDDVYTCKGTSVCYSNSYPLNYKQWGCGYSSWATFVATSYTSMIGQSLQMVTTGNDILGSPTTTTSSPNPSKNSAITTDSSISIDSSPSTSDTQISDTQTSSSQPTTPTTSTSSSSTDTPTPTPTNTTQKAFPTGPVIGGALGGILIFCFIASVALVAHRKGWFARKRWFGEKKEPVISYEPAHKHYAPPTPLQEMTVHIDSNPVYELGGGEMYKSGYDKYGEPAGRSPIVPPLMDMPETVSHGAGGHWGTTRSVRPVSELD